MSNYVSIYIVLLVLRITALTVVKNYTTDGGDTVCVGSGAASDRSAVDYSFVTIDLSFWVGFC